LPFLRFINVPAAKSPYNAKSAGYWPDQSSHFLFSLEDYVFSAK